MRAAWRLPRLIGALLILAATSSMAAAQPRDPAAEAQAIFTSVMSPYCPGLLLADCPSPAAFELRADIRRRLDAGDAREDVERDLYRKYGDVIRAVPAATGWGQVLWLVPGIVLALSFAALMWFFARSSTARVATPGPTATAPETDERLQEELDKLA